MFGLSKEIVYADFEYNDDSDYVYIPDQSLRNMIESNLGLDYNSPSILKKDTKEINNLSISPWGNYSNISGIQNFSNLKDVSIGGSVNITDYRPLSALVNLEALTVGPTDYSITQNPESIQNLNFIKPLKNLKRLTLALSVLDLTPLNELDNLTDIGINSSPSTYKPELTLPTIMVDKSTHKAVLANPVKLSKQFTGATTQVALNSGNLKEYDKGAYYEVSDIPEDTEYLEFNYYAYGIHNNCSTNFAARYKVPLYWY